MPQKGAAQSIRKGMLRNMELEHIVQLILDAGAYRAAVIDVGDIVFDRGFRALCEANACGNYGRCWMCPPDAGDIDTLMEEAKSYQKAVVYQTVGALEDSYDFEGMMEAGNAHYRLSAAIDEGCGPRLHLGAGGCKVCEVCAKRTDEPCRHPELAMASLETYGIAVSQLAESCGMKYINGQNTVTYFGGVFFRE